MNRQTTSNLTNRADTLLLLTLTPILRPLVTLWHKIIPTELFNTVGTYIGFGRIKSAEPITHGDCIHLRAIGLKTPCFHTTKAGGFLSVRGAAAPFRSVPDRIKISSLPYGSSAIVSCGYSFPQSSPSFQFLKNNQHKSVEWTAPHKAMPVFQILSAQQRRHNRG